MDHAEKHDAAAKPNYSRADEKDESRPLEVEEGDTGLVTLRQSLSRGWWILAWVGVILGTFAIFLDGVAVSTYQSYALSEFSHLSIEGGMLTVSSLVAIVIPGFLIPLYRHFHTFFIVIFGLVMAVAGLIAVCASQNVGTFVAGYGINCLGMFVIRFALITLAAELSTIRYRALSIAIANLPTLVSFLAGAQLAQASLVSLGWRWGYGIWAIIVPTSLITIIITLFISRRRMRPIESSSSKLTIKGLGKVALEQDIIGVLLLATASAMALLPIPLETGGVGEYMSPRILAPTIIGAVLAVFFIIWEARFAKKPLFPGHLLLRRNFYAPFGSVVFSTFSFALVTVYFFPYIIVTGNFNISNATYLANATTIAAPVFQLILGTVISWTQRAKWLFVFTNAMGLLAVGIQYAFYDPKSQLSGLVVAQIINGVSSGGIMNAMAMVQAAFGDEYIAVITASFYICTNVASAIGGAVAGGIWSSILPRHLKTLLPEELKGDAPSIMGSLPVATSFLWESSERLAINQAYQQTFRVLLVVAVVSAAMSFLLSFGPENISFHSPLDSETARVEKDVTDGERKN